MLLAFLIFLAALVYSMVGHAGASGYLAAMGLMDIPPATMKPAALALNLFVATIGTFRFARAGYFRWHLFWPFAVASIPLAYLGGKINLPTTSYQALVGLALLAAAVRLWMPAREGASVTDARPPLLPALLLGGGIGLLSGLTGVGGGIYLSPVILLMGWAGVRETAAVSVAFIFVNSASGLYGYWSRTHELPSVVPTWAVAAVLGGLIGTEFGTKRLPTGTLRRVLAAVLVLAGAKMGWSAIKG